MKKKTIYGPMPNLTQQDKYKFNKPNDECLSIYFDKQYRPVIVSKTIHPYFPYKVNYVISVVFPTLEDAIKYCDSNFKKAPEK